MSPDVEIFLESIKPTERKTKYNFYLRKYMEKYDIKKRDPKLIEGNLIRYIVNLKKIKSFSAVNNYLSLVITFYKMNDDVLNTLKIGKFLLQHIKVKKDREEKIEIFAI
jgi:hypothetical protein